MANEEQKVILEQNVLLESELKTSFLDYAMSVIVSRAIPDIRDGLKPVHRRILYTMHQLGFHYNKPYHKSVRVVGEALGKYHPHGDQSLYNAMVGMAQDFSRRYKLLDGQGNWGSIDGDNAAAMRYTEVRMAKISQEMLADIDKETVQFIPNFDESTLEPTILPSRLPSLLINGTAGIAVGMATSIPPHNITEVLNACIALLNNENLSDSELFDLIPGPDFPTGALICGRAGILEAYRTGRGRLILRAVVEVEETKKGTSLVVTELPYQVNKAELAIKIAELVKNKEIEGISNIRDESNKKGIRLVIELRRGEVAEVVLNQLYKYTALQSSVSILMLALLDNRPMVFTLRQMLQEFLLHREEIIYRRTRYDLQRAQEREHVLHGFITALNNIDAIVALIKGSQDAIDATLKMAQEFQLSEAQSKAILEMRLQRLTGLEQAKIHDELAEIKATIAKLNLILSDREELKRVILEELQYLREQYGDERRSRIEGAVDILTEADLIPDEEVVVTLTRKGYVKRVDLGTYDVQHRGGRGKMGMADLSDSDDIVQDLFVAKTHDELLFFTNLGRVYSLNVFEVPEGSRTAKGRAIVNLLPLVEGETVVRLLCARDLAQESIVMVTKGGTIKKTEAAAFAKIRATGIRAIGLNDGDTLVYCGISSGQDTIVIATANGQGIRFNESEVRQMGRQAAGVRGIKLREGDYVVAAEIVSATGELLFATERGYGKRVDSDDFRVAHRGGVGVRTIPANERNGKVIGLALIQANSQILLIDHAGKIIRLLPTEVRTMGRQAQGVRLIRLDADQVLSSIVSFEEDETADQGSEQASSEQSTVAAGLPEAPTEN